VGPLPLVSPTLALILLPPATPAVIPGRTPAMVPGATLAVIPGATPLAIPGVRAAGAGVRTGGTAPWAGGP
jgi:hypothetical protein